MSLYKDKYRIESTRLKNWDYSSDGYYFITICIKIRRHFFGKIINNEMRLSDIGEIVLQEWNKSFDIRTELFCDCFVIMPDHIHGVILIKNSTEKTHAVLSLRGRGHVTKSISCFVGGF